MRKALTIEQFIDNAKKIHGNVYNYSKVNYKNNKVKIVIICSTHGEFLQRPQHHLNGAGCPLCGKSKTKHIHPEDLFIKSAKLVHGEKYDYSNLNYIKKKVKVSINCNKHGIFYQTPLEHLSGRGCPSCGRENTLESIIVTYDEFLKRANYIHNDKYVYSPVDFDGVHKKIKILCPIHGEFNQTPNSHISDKHGCPRCVHRISKDEVEFLTYCGLPADSSYRQVLINKKYVDGFKDGIIYEFLGDYYHGNPSRYVPQEFNRTVNKRFGELYEETFNRFYSLKNSGFTIKYIWEFDWKRFKRKIDKFPNILTY